jgi:hypothetical protein
LIENGSCISWTSISFDVIVQGNIDEKMEEVGGYSEWQKKGKEVYA